MAQVRCLEASATDRVEFTRVPPPPAGTGPLTKEEWKAATDRLRESIIRKNAAGNRVIDELDRCRAAPPPAPAEPKVKPGTPVS